jgi:TPR repeat protein
MKSLRCRTHVAVFLLAISIGSYFFSEHLEYVAMHSLPPGLKEFNIEDAAPQCARWKDHMPKNRDREAYNIYIQARNLFRSNIEWKFTKDELSSIFNDVKLAANRGDWGARALLAKFYREGLGPLEKNHMLDPAPEKAMEIVRMAVTAGQPWGYYDLGVAYENGFGVPYDERIAWAYYLKAAELGSPDAQMALAEAYSNHQRKEDRQAMLMCAYRQGHGPAAYELGTFAKIFKKFDKALVFYQQGTKFGSRASANSLLFLFEPESWHEKSKEERDELMHFGIGPDADRTARYRIISSALEVNPDLRFARLDNAIPLPPAELPNWHGIEEALALETNDPPTY